ncbi:MAG: acetate--CoA ligase family protein [Spirochaetes bacterium]|nr:acetate--CoA ligase family protein [Spirochaetota bacterium]
MEKFFYPESLVVIGVSLKRVNLGHIILANNIQMGFTGRLYGVGREAGELRGIPVYTTVGEIPEVPDTAIIITPAKTVPGIMTECGEKGIRHIVIESGGFTEYSGENRSLEEEVLEIARRYGMRIIGPNCIGTINTENQLFMPFAVFNNPLKTGPLSIVSQSGGVGDTYMRIANENHIFFNKFVAVGNKLDIDEVDCLEYLVKDGKTSAVLMYLEGFSRGRDFFNAAMKSAKPIVIQKSNRTPMSAKIAQSHTAALSASDDVVGSALHQAAAIRVKSEDELIIAAKTLKLPIMKGNRVAVLSRSGGHAVITVDACSKYGFELIEFPPSFIETIRGLYDTNIIAHQNPLDLGEIFDYTIFTRILEETIRLENVDGIIFNHLYQSSYEAEMSRTFLNGVSDLVEKHRKPVAVTLISDAAEILDVSMNHPYPTFTTPLQAATALWGSHYYHLRREARDNRGAPLRFDIDLPRIDAIRERCAGESRIPLTDEALDVCAAAGIIPVRGARISGGNDPALAAFPYPAAIKLLSRDASHKSDIGGVRLNLGSPEEAATAIDEITRSLGALNNPPALDGFLLQKMSGGEEFFIGGRRDPVFGPIVMAGFGGIFIELFRDRAIRIAPVTPHEADDMLRQLKTYPILKGIRGRGPLDTDALRELICRVSHLICTVKEIEEIDLNPVMVRPKGEGVSVVDSRVFFKV